MSSDIDALLDRAAAADPLDRIELRDAIAAHGADAIEPMAEWLTEPRLSAFAVRVLERIGRQDDQRDSVIEVLTGVDRSELPERTATDVERALKDLGGHENKSKRSGARRPSAIGSPVESPGLAGRGYWVMRTSPVERAFIWAEAQRGRLRQGWGWNAEMNLDMIADVIRRGGTPSDAQRASWRSRRMRTGAADSMLLGDIVLAPNLPNWGVFSLFRVVGSYQYSMVDPRQYGERFGHVLPVELLVGGVDRRAPNVPDSLRAMLRPQSRLFNITAYGGHVERLIHPAFA